MCGIWDWQSTIVKDLNDSQDPKHMLICRENAIVAIYALFSDNKCLLFTRFSQKGHFFGVFQASVSECLWSEYAPGTPRDVGENKFTRRPILLHGVKNL